jgi:hypothetical protein
MQLADDKSHLAIEDEHIRHRVTLKRRELLVRSSIHTYIYTTDQLIMQLREHAVCELCVHTMIAHESVCQQHSSNNNTVFVGIAVVVMSSTCSQSLHHFMRVLMYCCLTILL